MKCQSTRQLRCGKCKKCLKQQRNLWPKAETKLRSIYIYIYIYIFHIKQKEISPIQIEIKLTLSLWGYVAFFVDLVFNLMH